MPRYFVRVLWHGHPHRLQAEITSACVLEARDEKAAQRYGWLMAYAECDSQNALDMCDVEVEALDKHLERYDGILADYAHEFGDQLAEDLFYQKHTRPDEHPDDPTVGNQLPVWA